MKFHKTGATAHPKGRFKFKNSGGSITLIAIGETSLRDAKTCGFLSGQLDTSVRLSPYLSDGNTRKLLKVPIAKSYKGSNENGHPH
jgi:hypothetical protein